MTGFTLVETLVAMAGTIMAGTFLVGILINHNGVLYKESALVNEGLSLNDTLREIDENLRQTVAISSSVTQGSTTYTTDESTVVFQLPALSGSGVLENVYDYGVITQDSLNNKILRLRIFPDAQSSRNAEDKILTIILQSLQFTYYNKSGQIVTPPVAAVVGVNLSVLSKTGAIGSSRSASARVNLRNATP